MPDSLRRLLTRHVRPRQHVRLTVRVQQIEHPGRTAHARQIARFVPTGHFVQIEPAELRERVPLKERARRRQHPRHLRPFYDME